METNEEYIAKLENNIQQIRIERDQWMHNFERVVDGIVTHMHERFNLSNQAYSYRVSLFNMLIKNGYSTEDATDFIRLEMAEAFLTERLKYGVDLSK